MTIPGRYHASPSLPISSFFVLACGIAPPFILSANGRSEDTLASSLNNSAFGVPPPVMSVLLEP